MADSTDSRLGPAMGSDGFIDFYALLDQPPNATEEQLRASITALNNEAQANRDHRVMEKRREYESILNLLPQARTVLLDREKRARYDTYAADARTGHAAVSFETFMNQLTARNQAAGTDILTVADTTVDLKRKGGEPVIHVAPKGQAGKSLMGTLISMVVFFIALAVVFLVSHKWEYALLVAAIVAVVTWFVTHSMGKKVSS